MIRTCGVLARGTMGVFVAHDARMTHIQKSAQFAKFFSLAYLTLSHLIGQKQVIKHDFLTFEFRVHLNLLLKVLFTTTNVKLESILEAQHEGRVLKTSQNSLLFAFTRIIQVVAHLSGHLTWRGLVSGAEPLPLA